MLFGLLGAHKTNPDMKQVYAHLYGRGLDDLFPSLRHLLGPVNVIKDQDSAFWNMRNQTMKIANRRRISMIAIYEYIVWLISRYIQLLIQKLIEISTQNICLQIKCSEMLLGQFCQNW